MTISVTTIPPMPKVRSNSRLAIARQRNVRPVRLVLRQRTIGRRTCYDDPAVRLDCKRWRMRSRKSA
jgi:hypothetical protein